MKLKEKVIDLEVWAQKAESLCESLDAENKELKKLLN